MSYSYKNVLTLSRYTEMHFFPMAFRLFLNESSGLVTIIWVIAIILSFVYSLNRLLKAKDIPRLLKENRITLESKSATLSTLGVLGTFFGITWGLMGFNADDLDSSIPILLGGLKTAFFTSLTGMVCSLIYTWLLNHIYDEYDASLPSAQDESVAKICEEITRLSRTSTHAIETIKTQLTITQNNQTAFFNAALSSLNEVNGSLKEDIKGIMNSILLQTTGVSTKLKPLETVEEMGVSIKNISNEVSIISEGVNDHLTESKVVVADIERIARSSGESLNEVKAISETSRAHLAEARAYSETLHSEVADLEGKMKETNELLARKFNEFSELLKKSNTEALVEVMKGLTEEFQQQMGTLIERLVKENFDQLNKSVEQLNNWQVENKAMIQALTTQYKEMSENFANDAEALKQITQDTGLLVSDGGKLQDIIRALTKVMVDDTRFVEITKNLEDTAQLSRDNMEKFDESTEKLNEWVRKQRNFVDVVVQLMGKLEEINKINDYSSQFWKETKQGMEDSVGMIKRTSESLNENLRGINQEFYERLASTLSELDACIQAMVRKKTGN